MAVMEASGPTFSEIETPSPQGAAAAQIEAEMDAGSALRNVKDDSAIGPAGRSVEDAIGRALLHIVKTQRLAGSPINAHPDRAGTMDRLGLQFGPQLQPPSPERVGSDALLQGREHIDGTLPRP